MGKARVRDTLTGEPFQVAYKDVILNPDTVQTLVNFTVPVSKFYRIYRINVVCRMAGTFTIKKDNVVVGSGRTGPGESNIPFDFLPYLKAPASTNVKVEFTSRVGIPSSIVDIECYLQAGELVL